MTPPAYTPTHPARSQYVRVRGLNYHLQLWGDASLVTPKSPALVMLHGWMDTAASFQFVVDALAQTSKNPRFIIAPDWRGFGLTESPPADSYWFADYLGDLDALLNTLALNQPIDLLGHSMGGNVAMIYAGVRPQRVRRLINLEGFGVPQTQPEQAPQHFARWLNELQSPTALTSYDNLAGVAQRLMKNNPQLSLDKANWLASHWARRRDDGRWHILGDPAHLRASPLLHREEETLAYWRNIKAPLLWVEGEATQMLRQWGNRYPRADFESRLAVVRKVERVTLPQCGHMVHHDQPQTVARLIEAFLTKREPTSE